MPLVVHILLWIIYIASAYYGHILKAETICFFPCKVYLPCINSCKRGMIEMERKTKTTLFFTFPRKGHALCLTLLTIFVRSFLTTVYRSKKVLQRRYLYVSRLKTLHLSVHGRSVMYVRSCCQGLLLMVKLILGFNFKCWWVTACGSWCTTTSLPPCCWNHEL